MPLPTTRRVVTGHDQSGKSVIISDTSLTPANPLDPAGSPPEGIIPGFTNLFKTTGVPATNVQGPWYDVHGKKIGLVDQTGVVARIVDCTVPDEVNITHRTQSVDFGIVLSGTITMVLDDGSETVFREGDVCVQRGTDHAWKNVSTESCRMLFVLVPSVPIENPATGRAFEMTPTAHLEDEEHIKAAR
ncbi:hypothetical protein A1O7_04645 [Cladophialophora yegresii CBS 114405]|uniref:Cupin type-2 domain-containing protein n=1 Tax=Cladophialophora yegresii CBS 114405 TaxID=1182544 RepID=W9VXC6_9EURO|nr:uncharacterized protein A1O7_04645 [Cladophialophora yegresii CBS 114405]EXJ60492.1 hypothetical protein A1O7_04645 [Cladophialophora yegresii CBS 114405]